MRRNTSIYDSMYLVFECMLNAKGLMEFMVVATSLRKEREWNRIQKSYRAFLSCPYFSSSPHIT